MNWMSNNYHKLRQYHKLKRQIKLYSLFNSQKLVILIQIIKK